MEKSPGLRSRELCEKIRDIMFTTNTAPSEVKKVFILRLAKFLAESTIKENGVPIKAIGIALSKIQDEVNTQEAMENIMPSPSQIEVDERFTYRTIDYAIKICAKEATIDQCEYIDFMNCSIETLLAIQPQIHWEQKIIHLLEIEMERAD